MWLPNMALCREKADMTESTNCWHGSIHENAEVAESVTCASMADDMAKSGAFSHVAWDVGFVDAVGKVALMMSQMLTWQLD